MDKPLWKKAIALVPGFCLGALAWASQVGPYDAKSNVGKWAELVGISAWPAWLTGGWSLAVASVAVAGYYAHRFETTRRLGLRAWRWARGWGVRSPLFWRYATMDERLEAVTRADGAVSDNQAREELVSRVRYLTEQNAELERQLHRHSILLRYGVEGSPVEMVQLSGQELLATRDHIAETRPAVRRAHVGSVQLLADFLSGMEARSGTDHWLSLFLKESLEAGLRAYHALEEHFAVPAADPREALVVWWVKYNGSGGGSGDLRR